MARFTESPSGLERGGAADPNRHGIGAPGTASRCVTRSARASAARASAAKSPKAVRTLRTCARSRREDRAALIAPRDPSPYIALTRAPSPPSGATHWIFVYGHFTVQVMQ